MGYAEDSYRSSYDASDYSTLCLYNLNDYKYNMITDHIEAKYQYSVGSTLSFTKLENSSIIIGWSGSDAPSRWFPEMGGRFFALDEISDSKEIVYVSNEVYESNEQKEVIMLSGIEYEIVGYGWITYYNFYRAIGKASSQTVVLPTEQNNMYMIIPQATYQHYNYVPEMVLIHINKITYDELQELTTQLQREYPNIQITQSDYNSNDLKTLEKIRYVPFGLLFSIIIGVSLLKMISIWRAATKEIIYTYMICGMSRKNIAVILACELLCFIVLGQVFSLLTQRLLLPLLSNIGVSYMPNITDMFLIPIIAYLVVFLSQIIPTKI